MVLTVWVLSAVLVLSAQPPRQMENLGRGLVAINKGSGNVYLSWRLLGLDPANVGFNVYRSTDGAAAVKRNLNPITSTSSYSDTGVDTTRANQYFIRPVVAGQEHAASAAFTLPAGAPANFWLTLPLQRPEGGTTLDGVDYTYNANDCSVADLDGDGEYEMIVKWDPSNSKDNANSGYTGNVLLDAYKMNGLRLWRIDLGINIRAGAHYTQFMVYDFDGDGRAELACKTAPGTKDGLGNNVLRGNDNPNADYRNSAGYILSGPEYLTVFEGLTGRNLATVSYIPARGNVSDWGDSYGNRVDRFLACVAYLDGVRPSIVMCRGYYTRAVLAAWDWRNGQLTQRWVFDSNTSGNSGYRGQGNHNLSVADVDADGFDEVIYGACAIDHNGTGLYTTGWGHGDAMHVSDMDPTRPGLEVWDVHESASIVGAGEFRDARTGELIWGLEGTGDTGRGCAAHVDAAYPGYQMWSSASGGTYNKDGVRISTATPKINFLAWWDPDVQRETVDVADGSGANPIIGKWNGNGETRLLNLYSYPTSYAISANNGTKANPCLSGDILGDWREELVYRLKDSSALLIFFANTPSTNRFYTFMHDPQYRLSIAWQNTAYNQPPHPGFYVGAGMTSPPVPNIFYTPKNPALLPPANLTATAVASNRIVVSWTPDGNGVTCNVKRAVVPGGPYTTVISGLAANAFTDANPVSGKTNYYVVTASNGQQESRASSEAFAVASDLVLHLALDDGAGTLARDFSGNARHGLAVNDPVWEAGKYNGALSLPGLAAEHVQLPPGVVAGLDSFTASAWVKVAAFQTWARIFDFGSGTGDYMFLTPQYSSTTANLARMRFAIRTSSVSEQVINSSVELPAYSWVHVAVTLTGSSGRMYLNGVLTGSNLSMTLKPANLGTTLYNYLGRSQFSNDPYFNGSLDDFRIYNRALSAAEVAALARGIAMSPPVLNIFASEEQVEILWPASHVGWRLQKQTNPSGQVHTATWEDVAGAGLTNRVVLPLGTASGAASLFRLIYP